MGKPVIAGLNDYNIEAICKFFNITEGPLPWVIARDEAQLEERIRALISDTAYRQHIGARGRQFMEEVWSDAAVAKRMAEFYLAL